MIASIWGTAVTYTESTYDVTVWTHDGRMRIMRKENFDLLYHKLDEDHAALKEDCIEYTIFSEYKPLTYYPKWFREAIDDGWIVDDCCVMTFLEENGEVAMSPGSVVLRNYRGDLKYMERDTFDKYYDTLEG